MYQIHECICIYYYCRKRYYNSDSQKHTQKGELAERAFHLTLLVKASKMCISSFKPNLISVRSYTLP